MAELRGPRERLLGESTHPSALSLDELMVQHVGQLGPMQLYLFCLVSLTWLPAAITTLNLEFVGKDPVSEHLWRCTSSTDTACTAAFALQDPTPAFCTLSPTQWEWTAPDASIKSSLGLYCDREWLADLANSAFFLGFLGGAAAWGALSDGLGRRPVLIAACLAALMTTAATAAARGSVSYLLLRLVNGAAVAGIGLVAFTLACELVGPRWRGAMGIASQYFWCLGECILPLMAYLLPNWRLLMLACASTCLFALSPFAWVPESPRWLLAKGRADESAAVMKLIAVHNGGCMPAVRLQQPVAAAPGGTVWDTFRVQELRKRQLVLMFCWAAVSVAFFGVSLTLDTLGGSLYVNFFLGALVEFPAVAVAVAVGIVNADVVNRLTAGRVHVDRLGRKPLTIGFFAICGVSCLLCAALPATPGLPHVLRVAAAVGGKFGGSGAFNQLFIYTTELFPTVVRNASLGVGSASARVGGVAAPLVVLLASAVHMPSLPFLVVGLAAVMAAVACTLLPETMGEPLLDTIAEVARENACEDGIRS